MDIGHIKADPIRIKLTSQTPISLKPFRPSFSDNIEIKRQIEELLKYNVIRPSYSSYASPAMLVNKRNEGKIRLVIDYRKLNDIIKRDSEPIPRIDFILDKLSEANIFTTLDLLSGYHHLDIHPDDKEYTAFTTTHGLYKFNKLSFGLKNSPSQFQRVLRQILNKYDIDFCMNYFDDFIIFSNNFQEHLTHLKVILDICIKENIKLKLSKCKFATYQISFLGYEISNHQFSPSTNNIETIRNKIRNKTIRNKKDLQRVLGSINIYSKFIPNYAKLRLPLNNLLKKDVKWKWYEECETAFSKLKNIITSKPILAIYNPKYPIHLYTDASQEQIGSILKQEQPDGLLKPIAYRSRRMTSYESNYCVTEQECLAIIDALDFFLPYLDGVHFTIHTDHACLKYLKNIKNPKGRLFRWSLKLSMFDFEIKHIRGTENKEADFLSRYPIAHFVSDPELKQAQFDDNINDRKYTKFNGLLTIKKKGLIKSVVPPSLREKVLIRAHQDYGHIGVSKMLNLISPIYYWPYLIQDISNYVKHCEVCQLNKISHQKKFGLLESLPPAKDPFDLVSIDTVGGLNYYNSTKKFLHIIVDHATRYIWAFPSKSQTTDSYINCLNKIFQIQKPKQFLSDRAPSFTSPRFRKYLINTNIKQLLTSSSRPQCNGLNERLNQTIITRLRCKFNNLKGKSIPWTKLLDSVLNEYNNTPHSITGYTPTYLLYGKLPYDPPLKESEFYPPIDTARTNAYNNTLKFHQINKIRYDQHYQPSTFKVGDKVWLQTFYHPDNRKLMPPMSGPFTILKQISPVNYEIDKPQSNLGKTTMVIHSSKLRPYYPKEGFELKLTKSKIPTLEKKPSQQVAPKNHQPSPSGNSSLTIDHNGLHTVSRKGVTKIIIPKTLTNKLLQTVHTQYNHPGISQMTRLISAQYYWQGMSKDITQKVETCPTCQLTKRPLGPTYGELGQPPETKGPFDLLSLDTIAGFAKYGNAKVYLHVVVDHFSRYTWTFPSKSTSISTYQQVLKRVLQDGSPKRLLTDRAPAFTSPKFRSILLNRNNPQANGLCERLNATLTGKLRLLHLENPKIAWTKLVKRVTTIYNNTPHSVTGFPPIYLMFGVLPPELSDHTTPYPDIDRARKIAHTRTQNKHIRDKNAYDQRHKQPHFEIGDLVLVKIYHHPNTGKLAPYFTGPYTILEIISPNVVCIDRPNQPLQRDTDTVHVNKLRLYTENIPYITPPAIKIHYLQPQDNYTFPFKHLTPELFPAEPLTIKPTNSEPFNHLDPTIFTETRFTPFTHNNKERDIAHPPVHPMPSPPQSIE
ncbi:hypothetical protein LAZ67_7003643, partial [Cordylochernes scorpioides]